MRKTKVQIGAFEYTYNGIVSDVIFYTKDSEPWKFIFIKRDHGDMLSTTIKKGYRFTILLQGVHSNLQEIFTKLFFRKSMTEYPCWKIR